MTANRYPWTMNLLDSLWQFQGYVWNIQLFSFWHLRHVSLLQVIQLDAPSDPRDVLELTRLSVQTISGGQRSLTSRVDCRKCMKAHYSCHIQTEWTRTSRGGKSVKSQLSVESRYRMIQSPALQVLLTWLVPCLGAKWWMFMKLCSLLLETGISIISSSCWQRPKTQHPKCFAACWYFTACKADRPCNYCNSAVNYCRKYRRCLQPFNMSFHSFWSWPSWQLSRQKGREPPLDDYLSVGHGYLWCRRTCSHIWTINSFLACVIQSFPFWRPSASSGKHAVAFLFNMFFHVLSPSFPELSDVDVTRLMLKNQCHQQIT